MSEQSEVLFIGGRAGVGKTSLAAELHTLLSTAKIKHALIEGDNLDMAYPPPWEANLAEQNLAAMWSNYRRLGYRRLIYTNTVSVLETGKLGAAMSDEPVITAVLLGASDEVTDGRLRQRERGSALNELLERSRLRAMELEQSAPAWVHRLDTNAQNLNTLAQQLLLWTGWNAEGQGSRPDPRIYPKP
jgi:hypothetical protein